MKSLLRPLPLLVLLAASVALPACDGGDTSGTGGTGGATATETAPVRPQDPTQSDALLDRYADVKPHTTAAAVVFALTRADADGWVD